MSTQHQALTTVAHCISAIAQAELLATKYSDVVEKLCQPLQPTNPNPQEFIISCCLDSLAFICQDVKVHLKFKNRALKWS